MFGPKIWDFYAGWYDKLWVQKWVLSPSRNLILDTIATMHPPEKILDFGCGIGELCFSMSQHYPLAEITGIDPSGKMIHRAQQHFSGTNIQYLCDNGLGLLQNQKFDLVVSTHAFPYVPEKSKFLHEIKNILKPGGKLLMLFANQNNLYDAFCLKLVKLTTSKAEYPSVKTMHQFYRKAGFELGQTKPLNRMFLIPSVHMVEGIVTVS